MCNFERSIQVTEELINEYANVAKDFNPIHLNKTSAIEAGLPDRIAHGMLIMALSPKLITAYLQDGWFVSSQEAKMFVPILINDIFMIKLDPVEWTSHLHVYKIIGLNEANKKALRGTLTFTKITHI